MIDLFELLIADEVCDFSSTYNKQTTESFIDNFTYLDQKHEDSFPFEDRYIKKRKKKKQY